MAHFQLIFAYNARCGFTFCYENSLVPGGLLKEYPCSYEFAFALLLKISCLYVHLCLHSGYCVHTCTYIYSCSFMHLYILRCVHMSMCVHMCLFVHVRVYMCIHARLRSMCSTQVPALCSQMCLVTKG